MTYSDKQPDVPESQSTPSALTLENDRLRRENANLQEQAEGVAAANARAAELMVELEEANNTLKQEIARRKSIEEELRQTNRQMEARVTERTAELTAVNEQLKKEICERVKAEESLAKVNKDLEKTVDELTRSNKQLQDFVHIAAHDLKTPLRGIGTLAEWLAIDYGGQLDEQGKEQIALLVARVRRIDRLIDGMLRYSMIQRSKEKERLLDLNVIVKEVIERIDCPPHINISIAPDLPQVVGETAHIRQVFHNLIVNAIEYIEKPEGLITIECSQQNGCWTFAVADNGRGVEQKYFDRIFRMFETLSPRDELAVGLGLPIVKKIVELYAGKVWLESQPGKGSTFFFTLPAGQLVDDHHPLEPAANTVQE